jgi:hypothetical protein
VLAGQITADTQLRHPADTGTVAELLALLAGHEAPEPVNLPDAARGAAGRRVCLGPLPGGRAVGMAEPVAAPHN